jgi:hypothetical protein
VQQRKSARRLDWLVHILYDKVSFEYTVRRQLQVEGRIWNAKAHSIVNSAILKAKEVDNKDAAISSVNPYSFSVRSSSRQSVTYSVIVHPTKDAHCPCKTMLHQHVCWHIISCLLAVGMTDHDLLKCLGGFWGSKFGGYPVLWKSQTLLSASHPIPMPATSADKRPGCFTTMNPTAACNWHNSRASWAARHLSGFLSIQKHELHMRLLG